MKRRSFSKILSIVMALLMALSTMTLLPVAASAEGVVTVGTADELLAVVTEINNDANKFSGKTVQLTADIDLTGKTWVQIKEFQGTLDGNGYSIKNLTIAGTTNRLAMIDTLNGATIKNLYLVGTVTQDSATGEMVALLAVEAKGTNLIQNVYVGGTVTPGARTAKDAARNAGFLAYLLSGTTSFVGCESAIKMPTRNNNKVRAGFVAATGYGTTVNFTDCVYTGSMLGNTDEAAGFVGRVGGNVYMTHCLKLGAAIDATSQYRGAFFYLDTKTLGDGATYDETNPSTIVITDCYATIRQTGASVIGGHGTRSDGLYNVKIVYGGTTAYNYQAGVDTGAIHTAASAAVRTIGVGETQNLTTENFATVCPGFTNWVVTTQTVDYYFGDAVKVVPRGIIEMEQKVNAAAFGSDKYVQLKANVNDPTATDIRFVTNIKSADYDTVGYLVSLDGNAVLVVNNAEIATTATNTVYTSIIADGTPVAPDEAGTYWLALGINGVPASAKDTTIYVRPYAIKDGNVTLGTVASFTLNSVNQ